MRQDASASQWEAQEAALHRGWNTVCRGFPTLWRHVVRDLSELQQDRVHSLRVLCRRLDIMNINQRLGRSTRNASAAPHAADVLRGVADERMLFIKHEQIALKWRGDAKEISQPRGSVAPSLTQSAHIATCTTNNTRRCTRD
ncbi:hypothetical protein E2C01_008177 [Portunus trituberculatus]|uniref:Uncharacterized protein n=1 Tax=Portunus trituberculatus TaxID=210409 RepID=A0A5B7D039_PORTR|nr:hypothetical protein [Portunus trituberculatus]